MGTISTRWDLCESCESGGRKFSPYDCPTCSVSVLYILWSACWLCVVVEFEKVFKLESRARCIPPHPVPGAEELLDEPHLTLERTLNAAKVSSFSSAP